MGKKTSFAERSALVMRVADLLITHRDEYAMLVTNEMGKVLREAKAEVEKCATTCRYYAEHAESFLKTVDQPSDAKSYILILLVQCRQYKRNFPFWRVFRFAAPYLMAGNVALLKHAPNVCGVALAIEKLFLEAGFPKGVFQTLIVDIGITERIIDHDIVQGVTLTGSELAGSKVGALAGKAIKKSVLELGGSDVVIVLQDADMQKAAQVATLSRMQNAGQSCIAAKRFITVGKAKDAFTDAVQKEIAKLRQGNPFDENITTGPMARIDLAEKLEKQFKRSITKGAQFITGGQRNGCNFTPALLTNVAEGMATFDEEVFGPVASIIEAKDEAAAIRFANDSRYGLGAAIWSADIEKAQVMAKEIEAGGVFINALVKSDPRYPFGGIKKSGYGRELSHFGIHEFMNIKTIYVG
ncbi:MAG: NAD-dependent succinate-semialdehyde dehydrogenase [Chitinophagaceae bacterium]